MKMLEKVFRGDRAEADFLRTCYKVLLGREADPAGISEYTARLRKGDIDHAGVLLEMAASEEYRRGSGHYDLGSDPDLARYLGLLKGDLVEKLRDNACLGEAAYTAAWNAVFASERELVIGQAEYGQQHRRRFHELCNAIAVLTGELEHPRLLEIGVSEFSGIYRQLYPQLLLDCADRPVPENYPGFTPQRIQRITRAERLFSLDLNHPADCLPQIQGHYDMVLFAEVLEHLVVHPVDILAPLLALLNPGGYLYLTTPNFFRRENQARFAAFDNPQEVFPQGDGNWDLHYHHREYGHREMFDFIATAGGTVRAFYFSSCWDDPLKPPENPAQLSNMVFVIQSG